MAGIWLDADGESSAVLLTGNPMLIIWTYRWVGPGWPVSCHTTATTRHRSPLPWHLAVWQHALCMNRCYRGFRSFFGTCCKAYPGWLLAAR